MPTTMHSLLCTLEATSVATFTSKNRSKILCPVSAACFLLPCRKCAFLIFASLGLGAFFELHAGPCAFENYAGIWQSWLS